jgi:hypothetical protein
MMEEIKGARGRSEISSEEWVSSIWLEVSTVDTNYEERMFVKTGQRSICSDCLFIVNPSPSPCSDDSFCTKITTKNYVTGESTFSKCRSQNSDGTCDLFSPKRA